MVPAIVQALDAANRVQSDNHAEFMEAIRLLDEKITRIGAELERTEYANIRSKIRSVAKHVVEAFDTPTDSELLSLEPQQPVLVRKEIEKEPDSSDEPPTLKSNLASSQDSYDEYCKIVAFHNSNVEAYKRWVKANSGRQKQISRLKAIPEILRKLQYIDPSKSVDQALDEIEIWRASKNYTVPKANDLIRKEFVFPTTQ